MPEHDMTVDDGGGRQRTMRVNYPANSKRKAADVGQERPKMEKVVEGDVVQRKGGAVRSALRTFISEDSHTVIGYLLTEVLVPATKNAISDMVSQGIERVLYGESRPRNSRGGYTNYNTRPQAIGGRVFSDPRPPLSRQARASHDFGEIVISSRSEAEDVLDNLRTLIDDYGIATVADFYDLVGLTGEFTDDKYGWNDLRSARVRPIRHGYVLDMPRTHPLD
jgi:hypothetical protein